MLSPEVRPELYQALVAEGFPDSVIVVEVAQRLVGITDAEREKYQRHGLLIVDILMPITSAKRVVVFDLVNLESPTPKYAWFRYNRQRLTVVVSSGKQHMPKRAIEISRPRELQGIAVALNYNVSPNDQIPYRAELIPLYQPAISG